MKRHKWQTILETAAFYGEPRNVMVKCVKCGYHTKKSQAKRGTMPCPERKEYK